MCCHSMVLCWCSGLLCVCHLSETWATTEFLLLLALQALPTCHHWQLCEYRWFTVLRKCRMITCDICNDTRVIYAMIHVWYMQWQFYIPVRKYRPTLLHVHIYIISHYLLAYCVFCFFVCCLIRDLSYNLLHMVNSSTSPDLSTILNGLYQLNSLWVS